MLDLSKYLRRRHNPRWAVTALHNYLRRIIAEIDLTGLAEHTVGQLAGSEAGEADQLRLLFGRRWPVLLGDAVGNEDRRDIGAGAILPGGAKRSVAAEIEIYPKPCAPGGDGGGRQGGCRCWRHGIWIVVIGGFGREVTEGGDAQTKARRKGARAEHVEGKWVIAHGRAPLE